VRLKSQCTVVGILTSPLFPIETCPIQPPSIPPQPQRLLHSHSAAAPASEPLCSQPLKPKCLSLLCPQQHPACWHSVPIRRCRKKNETRMTFVHACACSGVRVGAAAETREANPGHNSVGSVLPSPRYGTPPHVPRVRLSTEPGWHVGWPTFSASEPANLDSICILTLRGADTSCPPNSISFCARET
jgi:hypothetical protein